MPTSAFARTPRPILLVLLLAVLAAPIASAGELTEGQQRTLSALAGHVTQSESNLKLAEDAAGPGAGAIPATKVKLVRVRLDPVQYLLPQIRTELDKLPRAEEVGALRARLDAADARVKALNERLGVQDAPKPAAGGAPLDHAQSKALADADFFLREMEGLAAAIAKAVAELRAAKDEQVDLMQVRTVGVTIERAEQRAEQVRGRLEALPPQGAGVADVAARHAAASKSVTEAKAAWEAIAAKVEAASDPARYPAFEAELERLQRLGRMFSDAENLFAGNPQRAAAIVREEPPAVAEAKRFEVAYAPLARQSTEAGNRVREAVAYFRSTHEAFVAAAKRKCEALPAAVDVEIAAIRALADTAVGESRPAYFANGIPERVRALEATLGLWAALDEAAAAPARDRVTALESELVKRAAALEVSIIEANELPANAYEGKDRATLEATAVEAWKRLESGAQILAVRIPARAWARETFLQYENRTWRLIDRSYVQALVLVALDDRIAIVRAVDLWIDHVSNDERKAFPLDRDAGGRVPPNRRLLRSKLR